MEKHQKEIDELKKQLGGLEIGGGAEVDMNAMDKRYALKGEPDLTVVRIEELEALTEMLLNRIIKHEKAMFQNSTLENVGSDKDLRRKIHEAVKKDRASSPIRRNEDPTASAVSNELVMSELDKVMAEIDKLNSNDYDLTTRVQILEKALREAHSQVNINMNDITALKSVKVDIPAGEIDTSAIFAKIAEVAKNLNDFKGD